jgi:hypothetical protein
MCMMQVPLAMLCSRFAAGRDRQDRTNHDHDSQSRNPGNNAGQHQALKKQHCAQLLA